MTTVNVKLSNTAVTLPAGWNQSTATPTSTQQLFANMIDSTGANTGLSLHITSVFGGKSGSSAWATMDYHGLPVEYWRSAWYATAGGLQIRGFAPGQTGTLLVSGHRASTGRNSNYRVNGGTVITYVEAATPAAPVTVPFTADTSGYVTLSVEVVSVFAYINGFVIDYTVSTSVDITDIDDVFSGQSATLTVSDSGYSANSLALSDGVVTKNLALTGSLGNFTFTGPSIIDGETVLRTGTVSAVATDGTNPTTGTTTTFTVRTDHPDNATLVNFSSVTLTDVSDPNTIGVALSLDPLPAVGWDIIYDAARFAVTSGGIVTSDYTGTSRFFLRNTSGVVSTLILQTSDGSSGTQPTTPTDTSVSIAEGETGIGVFTASAGTQPITYSLTGADAALFTVNSSTASVSKLTPVVFGQTYNITVVATNSFGSDSQNITITVTKVVSGDSNVTFKGGRLEAKESIATFRAKLPFQAQSVAADITALRTDFNSLLTKMTTAGWFEGGDEQLTMIKIALQCGLPQLVKRLKEQAPSQMPVQSASVASDVAALRTDFNALLTKLKDSNLMATS